LEGNINIFAIIPTQQKIAAQNIIRTELGAHLPASQSVYNDGRGLRISKDININALHSENFK